ncbi:iron-sulfur cluster assembly accessory protein [Salinibacterium sp. UTAS2018]|uniref:iron-sulfur cluster assembly accessory protein n=1 Tax=Salinibacterium sp. UTAS2018 TaxID=2508880 RepID=UPI0010095263|nr:iron-sulfur cluster assembly accessory protein [Salinibacterium sp. UTAS2018]QAV70022.1 iron-sulfur cluster assembly accessory protein [Salinibacterium sp. UTAS2018]
MLTLTETATTVVKTIVEQDPDAQASGLRINGEPGAPNLTVAVVAAPEAGDSVVEADGARVFLEENASVALSDKTLDANVGENGAVNFAVIDQA